MRDYKYSDRLDEWIIYGEDIQLILDNIDEVFEENKEHYSQDRWKFRDEYQKKVHRTFLGKKKKIPMKVFSNVWMRVVHKHFGYYHRSGSYRDILVNLGSRWENRLYKLYLKN